jgi:23S rRNA pseudouridine2604 synthase
MRINKYLAEKQYASRRGADELIKQKRVTINGRLAVLGDEVKDEDVIEVKKSILDKAPIYLAYNKAVGVVTHSPKEDEEDIMMTIKPLLKGELHKAKLFPIGRLDKDSHGLIILTDDGRITGKLLNPEEKHEKEYIVEVKNKIPQNVCDDKRFSSDFSPRSIIQGQTNVLRRTGCSPSLVVCR